jgi:hypothetical protein
MMCNRSPLINASMVFPYKEDSPHLFLHAHARLLLRTSHSLLRQESGECRSTVQLAVLCDSAWTDEFPPRGGEAREHECYHGDDSGTVRVQIMATAFAWMV